MVNIRAHVPFDCLTIQHLANKIFSYPNISPDEILTRSDVVKIHVSKMHSLFLAAKTDVAKIVPELSGANDWYFACYLFPLNN